MSPIGAEIPTKLSRERAHIDIDACALLMCINKRGVTRSTRKSLHLVAPPWSQVSGHVSDHSPRPFHSFSVTHLPGYVPRVVFLSSDVLPRPRLSLLPGSVFLSHLSKSWPTLHRRKAWQESGAGKEFAWLHFLIALKEMSFCAGYRSTPSPPVNARSRRPTPTFNTVYPLLRAILEQATSSPSTRRK